MVFESYVVDLLNKFAGQYLENLDTSQLRLGIWGGDVQLENLILKESALDDLALPVKVLRGHLGKLVLKIPWKNLYSEPVVAQVDGLYLLVRPSTDVKYNAEKEEKAKQERKQRQLEAVELTWQIEVEKKKENVLGKVVGPCGSTDENWKPSIVGKKVKIVHKVRAKTKGMLKRQSDDTKIFTPSPEVAQWLVGKIKEARS
ncbi:vacuolar protein sorting-associated protein 13-like [Pocillopora damicornis]|uniref:vacuolar protein sorting-associated protein 13-like n=1 Tax=Pocillopora damicornis TaxID=46731 RepID=UPI000F54D589|nr:vacuolar protein sorting-associated protein 13-like [Pocillopora damicornis]